MKKSRTFIIKESKHFLAEITYRLWSAGFGINIGTNYFIHKKIANFYIEITILFWTLGVEWRKSP